MDPLSHAVMGATFASARPIGRLPLGKSLIVGALAGMSPDLDVLIRSVDYPLLAIKYHRHFTHAIPVAPLWALLVAGALWGFFHLCRRPLPFLPVYLTSVLAVICHSLLDSMTNYGTHLFWPLTNARESWSIISIVDPLFTGVALLLLVLAAVKKNRQFLHAGILFMVAYWGLGLAQQGIVTRAMESLAAGRGHAIEKAEVKPSFGNLLAWRSQYQAQGRIHIDAFHHSPWAGIVHYEGGSRELVHAEDSRFAGLSPIQRNDLEDFSYFSDGWLTQIDGAPERIADARFGLLPNSLEPFWAVELYPDQPERHAGFVTLRRPIEERDWAAFWQMIRGEAP